MLLRTGFTAVCLLTVGLITEPALATRALSTVRPSEKTGATSQALAMPFQSRLSAIREQGSEGYKNLVSIMQDDKQTMENRWRAVTALGRVGGDKSVPDLERALHAREWYLRNAGLIAMTNVDRDRAKQWARKFLADKALMVRVAAVDLLSDMDDRDSDTALWEKLNAPQNFRGKQSLFIRRHIVETLSRFASRGEESKFVALLSDRDASLHEPAMNALERITNLKLGGVKEAVNIRRERWQSWWQDKQASETSVPARAIR